MATTNVETQIAQLQSILQNAPKDPASRQKLYDAVSDMALKLEGSGDTMQRVCYLPLQLSVANIAVDLGLFDILANSTSPLGLDDLQKKTGADQVLLRRVLRYLASVNMVEETGADTFKASNITQTLSRPLIAAGLRHNFNMCAPAFQELPKFLKDTKYQNPYDVMNSPFQRAFQIDEPPFLWVLKHPYHLENANKWMSVQREGSNEWPDAFNFEAECCAGSKITPETPVFVDVGGGIGHQCQLLKDRYPNIQGRVILQDQPPMVAQALPLPGVEKMAHDFWTPEPVKGARAYYMRNILHDYPDEAGAKILRQLVDAMDKDSVILIDEMVLPTTGTHWRAAQLDFTMMSAMAAMERTEQQWKELLDKAGLKIKKVVVYNEQLRDSIIVVVPK